MVGESVGKKVGGCFKRRAKDGKRSLADAERQMNFQRERADKLEKAATEAVEAEKERAEEAKQQMSLLNEKAAKLERDAEVEKERADRAEFSFATAVHQMSLQRRVAKLEKAATEAAKLEKERAEETKQQMSLLSERADKLEKAVKAEERRAEKSEFSFATAVHQLSLQRERADKLERAAAEAVVLEKKRAEKEDQLVRELDEILIQQKKLFEQREEQLVQLKKQISEKQQQLNQQQELLAQQRERADKLERTVEVEEKRAEKAEFSFATAVQQMSVQQELLAQQQIKLDKAERENRTEKVKEPSTTLPADAPVSSDRVRKSEEVESLVVSEPEPEPEPERVPNPHRFIPTWTFDISLETCNHVTNLYWYLVEQAMDSAENLGCCYAVIGFCKDIGKPPEEFIKQEFHCKSPITIAINRMRREGFKIITGKWNIPCTPQVILFDESVAKRKVKDFIIYVRDGLPEFEHVIRTNNASGLECMMNIFMGHFNDLIERKEKQQMNIRRLFSTTADSLEKRVRDHFNFRCKRFSS